MADFKELVKKQRSQGAGVVGSISTAMAQKTLEKIDPRNYLFDQKGLMTALFPSLKGYQAKVPTVSKSGDEQVKQAVKPPPVMIDKENSQKLSRIETNTKLTAKNNMILPMMARDINLMRQNIRKLVSVSGETPAIKADMFFKRSAEREAAYESKFKKSDVDQTKASKSPTKAEEPKKDGFFSSILGSLSSFLPSILKFLLVGGLITALIGKLAENPEIKQMMKDAFVTITSGLFDAIKKGFEFFSEVLKDPKVQESIQKSVESFFNFVGDLLNTKVFSVMGMDVTLGGAIGLVVAGLVAFKAAVLAASAALYKIVAAAGRGIFPGMDLPMPDGPDRKPGPGKPGPGSRRPGLGRAGIVGLAVAGAYGLNQLTRDNAIKDGQQATEAEGIQPTGPTKEQITERKSEIATEAAISAATLGLSAVPAAQGVARGAATAALNVATTPPTGKWGKFLEFVAKKSPKLFTKLGTRLATAGAMLAVPGPGWIATLINLGLSFWSAYDLYQLWREYNNLPSDDSANVEKPKDTIPELIEATPGSSMASEMGPMATGSAAPTPVVSRTTGTRGAIASSPSAPQLVQAAPGSSMASEIGPTVSTASTSAGSGVSESLVNFVKSKEGFTPKAKWDYQQYSIGYGTKANNPNEVIDEAEADRRLRAKLEEFQKIVIDYGNQNGYSWNQGQIDGLTSFVYNLGPGSLRQVTANGTRSNEEIAKKMVEYNKADGKVLRGLTTRRKEELAMFQGGGYPSSNGTEQTPAERQRMLALNKTEKPSPSYFDFFDKMGSGGKETMANLFGSQGISKINLTIGDKKHTINLGKSDFINKASTELADKKSQPPNVIIDAKTVSPQGQQQQTPSIPSAKGVVDRDFAELLFRKAAGETVVV